MKVGFLNYGAALAAATISQLSDVQMRASFQKQAGSRYANSAGSRRRTFPPPPQDSLKALCKCNVAALATACSFSQIYRLRLGESGALMRPTPPMAALIAGLLNQSGRRSKRDVCGARAETASGNWACLLWGHAPTVGDVKGERSREGSAKHGAAGLTEEEEPRACFLCHL